MSVSLASLYITKLLIIGCVGDSTDNCPQSVEPETWTGLVSMDECQKFIRQKKFDPVDYLPGYETYMVQCQPQD